MHNDDDAPLEGAGDTISALMQQLLDGIPQQAGGGAERQAWALLHHVRETLAPHESDDPAAFRANLVTMSSDFVRSNVDEQERHDRLLATDHLLVNMLAPFIGDAEDDMVLRFEELREGLFNIERINGRNPSVETRLRSIYGGLVEVSQALGYIAIAPSTV